MQPHAPALGDVIHRLGRLRRRIRGVLALTGAARWVLAAAAAAALFFAADRFLDLPLGVRRFVRLGLLDHPDGLATPLWVFLLLAAGLLAVLATRAGRGTAPFFAFAAGGVLGVLLWFAVRTLVPLGVHLPEQELALAVERRFKHLNDRLAAALDFEREIQNPTRGESVAMMESVVADAAREAEGLQVARVVSTRRATRWGLSALAAVAACAVVAAAMPDDVALWARRSLMAEDVAWPRATTLEAVVLGEGGSITAKDPAVPYRVAIGRPLVVHARAVGDVPDGATLLDLSDEGRPFRRRMTPLADRTGLFAVEIRDVRRPFTFALQGGDDEDDVPRWRVEVTIPPQVRDLRTDLVFPAYLGRAPESHEGGNVAVPEGTTVTVSFTPDGPVEVARALVGEESVVAEPVARERYGFSFAAAKTTRYRILLRTPDGRESDPAHDAYEVRVEADRAPRLEWTWPRGPVEVTPVGRVPLLAKVTDDHGVSAVRLEVRLAEGATFAIPLVPYEARGEGVEPAGPEGRPEGFREPAPALDGPLGRAVVRLYLPLEVVSLLDAEGRPPAAPGRLAVRLVATDSKGQSKEGAWSPVDVYRAADLERTLAGRRSGVRTEIAGALGEQVERRRQTAEVLKGPVGDPERDLLKTIQFAQTKIAQDTDRATRSLLALVNDFVYDRLGADVPNGKILAMLDRLHRETYGEAAPVADATRRLGDPVFPYALYGEVAAAWRERVIFDTAILDRMLAVVAEAVPAGEVLAGAAERAAAAAASGDPERLREAIAAQDALVAALERVLETMRSWQSLNDVILAVRRLVEEQTVVNSALETDGAGSAPAPRSPVR